MVPCAAGLAMFFCWFSHAVNLGALLGLDDLLDFLDGEANFTNLAPLGYVGLVVAMSVCVFV